MRITGSWFAFQEYMDRAKNFKYVTLCYTLRPGAGLLDAVLIDTTVEWIFLPEDRVTVPEINQYGTTRIHVKSWNS